MFTKSVLTRPMALGLLLTGCGSETPRALQVICPETPAYASRWGSESSSSVVLGNTFQVAAVALSSRVRITGARGDTGTERFLAGECLAPYPLQGQARWIQMPVPASEKAKGWEMGEEVEALPGTEPWVPTGQTAVLSQGAVLGFVPATALGDKPPPLERYPEALSEQLARGAFDEALALARKAAKTFPQEARFHRLLGLLAPLQGGPAPKPPKSLPRLAALPEVFLDKPLVMSEQEQEAGSEPLTVYSAAVGLKIRETSDDSAEVIATLNVNQPLEVFSIEGDQASVGVHPGHQPRLSYETGARVDFIDAPTVEGYVSARFLARAPLDAGQGVARAQASLQAGRAAEALVLFHRALEAQPGQALDAANTAYLGLIRASFAAGRFENLFQAISARRQPPAPRLSRTRPRGPVLLYGCHGDMARAKISDLANAQGRWAGLADAAALMHEPDLCIASVDTREPEQPHESCQDGPCEPSNDYIRASYQYSDVHRPEYEKWHDAVTGHFDTPSYLFFAPDELQGLTPGRKLVLYGIPLKEDTEEPEPSGVVLDKEQARVTVLHLPQVLSPQPLEVWIELPGYYDFEFGLAIVDSEDQVLEWIQQREDHFDYPRFRVPVAKASQRGRRASFPLVQRLSLPEKPLEYGWNGD